MTTSQPWMQVLGIGDAVDGYWVIVGPTSSSYPAMHAAVHACLHTHNVIHDNSFETAFLCV